MTDRTIDETGGVYPGGKPSLLGLLADRLERRGYDVERDGRADGSVDRLSISSPHAAGSVYISPYCGSYHFIWSQSAPADDRISGMPSPLAPIGDAHGALTELVRYLDRKP